MEVTKLTSKAIGWFGAMGLILGVSGCAKLAPAAMNAALSGVQAASFGGDKYGAAVAYTQFAKAAMEAQAEESAASSRSLDVSTRQSEQRAPAPATRHQTTIDGVSYGWYDTLSEAETAIARDLREQAKEPQYRFDGRLDDVKADLSACPKKAATADCGRRIYEGSQCASITGGFIEPDGRNPKWILNNCPFDLLGIYRNDMGEAKEIVLRPQEIRLVGFKKIPSNSYSMWLTEAAILDDPAYRKELDRIREEVLHYESSFASAY